MTPTTTRTLIEIGLAGAAITVALVAAALVTAQDPTRPPAPVTTTVTTTVTTPVAPCHHEDCPPWPSLDQGDEDR